MKSINRVIVKGSACLPLIALALSGCATVETAQVIKPGDRVGVHFTCRLPNGEIASSTDKSVAENSALPKSAIFLASSGNDSIKLPTGSELDELRKKPVRGMEEEIISQLSDAVVGMNYGERRTMKLTAATVPVSEGDNHILQMARVRHRPKELHLSLADYKSRKHGDPLVGQDYTIDPAFPGKVAAVTENEVVVRFSAKAGDLVSTPFGKGVIRELDDSYEIEIDALKGSLVRSGPLVGRISAVDDRFISIDFANSFAGEELTCDVRAEKIAAEKIAAAKAVEKAPVDLATPQLTKAEGNALVAGVDKAIADAVKKGAPSADVYLAGNPAGAQKGDLVTVNFTASLEDGALVGTTLESVAIDPKRKKVSWFKPRDQYVPEEIKAGSNELMPGLSDAVIDMAAGEKKQITLSPEKAFGPRDETKTAKFPLQHTVPATITMSADDYVKRIGGFPVTGKEVSLDPYLKAKVTSIGEKDVTLSILATDGAQFSEPYGTVTEAVGAEGVTLKLAPIMGAAFQAGDRQGVITASDKETFSVDFNNPLAGKTIILDLEAVKVTRAAALNTKPIEWIEEYDAGLTQAKKRGKPVFLLLYADWCGWCKKTMTETIPDPRISGLQDKFVWVKVNSDKEKKYKQQYGQNGFPMIVLLKPDGTVLKKIDGYRDARALKAELEGVI